MVRAGEEGGANRGARGRGVFQEQIAQPEFDRRDCNVSRFHELAMIATATRMITFVPADRSRSVVG